MSETSECQNCLTPLKGAYCYECGQSVRGSDRFFLTLVNEAFEDIFSMNSRVWKTFGNLLWRPGFLSNEYFAGRRVRYIPPIRLYFTLSILFFLVYTISSFFDAEAVTVVTPQDQTQTSDGDETEAVDANSDESDNSDEGFEENEIKTAGFNAQPYYEYQNGKRQQKGFNASQNMEVIFAYDQERLISIVKELSMADIEPNLSLGFQLSDELTRGLKKELLEKAMANAKAIATTLAATQGKKLEGFSEIRYGVVNNQPQPIYRENAMMMKADADMGSFGGFEAKTIPLFEEVTVVWKVN